MSHFNLVEVHTLASDYHLAIETDLGVLRFTIPVDGQNHDETPGDYIDRYVRDSGAHWAEGHQIPYMDIHTDATSLLLNGSPTPVLDLDPGDGTMFFPDQTEMEIPESRRQSPRIPDRSFDHWVNGTSPLPPTYVEPRPPSYRFEPAKDLEEWAMA